MNMKIEEALSVLMESKGRTQMERDRTLVAIKALLNLSLNEQLYVQEKINAQIIKPCPFCGNTASHITRNGHLADYAHAVQCNGCSVSTYGNYTNDEAAAAWNRRDSTPDPKIATVMRHALDALEYAHRAHPKLTGTWARSESIRELKSLLSDEGE